MTRRPWSGKKQLFFLLLYVSDVVMFGLSVFAVSSLMGVDYSEFFYIRLFLFLFVVLMLNYTHYRLYKDKRSLFDDEDFMRVMYSAFVTFFMAAVFIVMFDPTNTMLWAVSALVLILNLVLSSLGRFVLYRIIYLFRLKGYDRKKVIFFGDDNRELRRKVRENKSLGYRIIRVTKSLAELKKSLGNADIVFLTSRQVDERLLNTIIKHNEVSWKIVPSVLNLVIDPVSFDEFRDYPIINVSTSKANSGYAWVKRVIDVAVSGVSLILLSPLFLLVALLIKLTMPGPVFFRHERLGKDLKPFMLYKFRSMVVDAEKKKKELMHKNETRGIFKMKNDPRVTRLGKILRRSCIDELPQLINIFKGEMSLVGPRPHLKIELDNFRGWRRARFRVKPGLTGMWQVNGRHELNFDKAVLYDIYYVRNMSFMLDLMILLKTVPAILMTRGRY